MELDKNEMKELGTEEGRDGGVWDSGFHSQGLEYNDPLSKLGHKASEGLHSLRQAVVFDGCFFLREATANNLPRRRKNSSPGR